MLVSYHLSRLSTKPMSTLYALSTLPEVLDQSQGPSIRASQPGIKVNLIDGLKTG